MSTATTTARATAPATSERLKTFSIAFSLAAPVIYVIAELFGLPLFTYHPATNRIELGWTLGRSGEGPVMYWYGWVVTTAIGASVLGALATLLPEGLIKKAPLALTWLLPLFALALLAWSLRSFFLKG